MNNTISFSAPQTSFCYQRERERGKHKDKVRKKKQKKKEERGKSIRECLNSSEGAVREPDTHQLSSLWQHLQRQPAATDRGTGAPRGQQGAPLVDRRWTEVCDWLRCQRVGGAMTCARSPCFPRPQTGRMHAYSLWSQG